MWAVKNGWWIAYFALSSHMQNHFNSDERHVTIFGRVTKADPVETPNCTIAFDLDTVLRTQKRSLMNTYSVHWTCSINNWTAIWKAGKLHYSKRQTTADCGMTDCCRCKQSDDSFKLFGCSTKSKTDVPDQPQIQQNAERLVFALGCLMAKRLEAGVEATQFFGLRAAINLLAQWMPVQRMESRAHNVTLYVKMSFFPGYRPHLIFVL